MDYLERILEPGERVRYIGRLHWLIYWPSITLLLVAIILMIAAALYQEAMIYLFALGAIALVAAVVVFVPEFIRRRTTEIAVTDRRIIFKAGLFRRHSIEMNMDKVESIDVDQSVFGRLFDFGTVLIRGTGASLEPLYQIKNPLKLRSQITAR